MKKGLGKRLVSLILCAAMLVTMAPDLIYAAQRDRQNVTVQKESGENVDAEESAVTETAAAQQAEDKTEKSLEYALNGGSFVEGYTAPGTYPQTDLPDWQDVTNPEGNPCYFTFEIVLTETAETIYTSKMVEPGKAITEVELTRALEPGEYLAVLKITTASLEDGFWHVFLCSCFRLQRHRPLTRKRQK